MTAALGRRVAVARGALWAARACLAAHRGLTRVPLDQVELPRVPGLPRSAGRGVQAVLRRTGATCLERALVRQRWLASQGSPRHLVIGVSRQPPFAAHAWLEGDPAAAWEGYEELSRHPV